MAPAPIPAQPVDPIFAEMVAAGVDPDVADIVLALAEANASRDYARLKTPSEPAQR